MESVSKWFGVVDVIRAEVRRRRATTGDFVVQRRRFERQTVELIKGVIH